MDKLQQLTEKLFNEGLNKGRLEGEAVLADAQAKAELLIADAKAKAAAIIASAEKQAADLTAKAESDIKMASSQTLQATKKDIETLLVSNITDAPVSAALAEPDFLKQIIKAVAEKFSSEQSSDIALVLPAALQEQLEPFVKEELTKTIKAGVDVTFSKKVAGGLTIGPADGSYFISLTDESFKSLIAEYLRPVTRKLLFG